MRVWADEVRRSLGGTLALVNRRAEGLKAFDLSEHGFWRSFAAIGLTLPAFVVALAFERSRLGLLQPGEALVDASRLTLVVAAGHMASFLALPLVMIGVARRLGLGHGYVPFVVVTNWVLALGLTLLSVPAILLLIGWATPAHAVLFALGFGVIVLRTQWFAAKVTLGVSGRFAAAIVLLGMTLDLLIAGTVDTLAR